MTKRGGVALLCGGVLFILSLALESRLYRFFGVLVLMAAGYALLSCLWGALTLQADCDAQENKLCRGETLPLHFCAAHRSILPLGDIHLEGYAGEQGFSLQIENHEGCSVSYEAGHVGIVRAGISRVYISDLFGFFRLGKKHFPTLSFLVLPPLHPIEATCLQKGQEGDASQSRAQEDYTSPEDVRAYQPGDALKRVHWKLYARRHEMLVRRYETPTPPETLILCDFADPSGIVPDEQIPFVRDWLCERALSCAGAQLSAQSPVRLPFYGSKAGEFAARDAENLPLLQEMLARQPFDRPTSFSAVLGMEMRNLRKAGAIIIITHRLDAAIADGICALRASGPNVRLYLLKKGEDQALSPLLSSLHGQMVEVKYESLP